MIGLPSSSPHGVVLVAESLKTFCMGLPIDPNQACHSSQLSWADTLAWGSWKNPVIEKIDGIIKFVSDKLCPYCLWNIPEGCSGYLDNKKMSSH